MRVPDVTLPDGRPRGSRFARGWRMLAVAAAILVVGPVAPFGDVPASAGRVAPAAVPGHGGRFRFAPGVRIVHRIDYRSEGSTNFLAVFGGRLPPAGGEPPPGLVQSFRSEVRGERSVTILQWRDGAWLADVRMARAEVSFSVDGRADAAQAGRIRRDLARGLFIRITPEGKVVSVRFPPDADTLAKTFEQSLLGITQFVFPRDAIPADGRWTADEDDRSGRCAVLYERLSADNAAAPVPSGEDTASYRKTRLRYAGPARRGPVKELSLKPRTEPKGHLIARFRDRDGTLLSLSGTEVQDVSIGDNRVGHAENTLDMESLRRGTVSAGELSKLRKRFDAMKRVSEDVALSTNVSMKEGRLALDRRALGEATAQSLLSDLEAADRSGGDFDPLLLRRLEALFALDPAACGPFGERMAAADVESRLFRYVSAALASVGHARAQEALIDAVRTRRKDVPAVVALIAACQDVRAPGLALVEMLGEIAFGGKDERQVVRAAWSALGTAAANLEPVHTERAAKIVDALVRETAKATSEEETVALLSALGNSASSRALPAILKRLGDPSVDIRAAAASALRTMDAPEVEPALLRALSADPAEAVRRQAASALQNREMTEAALDVQASALLKDDSANVRMRLLRTLAYVIGRYPKARMAIRGAAEKDPSEDIRKAARGILDENPEAGRESK